MRYKALINELAQAEKDAAHFDYTGADVSPPKSVGECVCVCGEAVLVGSISLAV